MPVMVVEDTAEVADSAITVQVAVAVVAEEEEEDSGIDPVEEVLVAESQASMIAMAEEATVVVETDSNNLEII